MAEKLECDRCKMIDSPEEFETIRYYDGHWRGTQEYSLCKKCHKEFRKIFDKFLESTIPTEEKDGTD